MDCKNIREQAINLTSRLQVIEQLHKETLEKIINLQSECNHNLILINKKYDNKVFDYVQYGKCLVCGKDIKLTPENINLDNKKQIHSKNIIDISDGVEYWCLDCDCALVKSELEVAQKVFDDLIKRDPLRFQETAKYEIMNALKKLWWETKTKTK